MIQPVLTTKHCPGTPDILSKQNWSVDDIVKGDKSHLLWHLHHLHCALLSPGHLRLVEDTNTFGVCIRLACADIVSLIIASVTSYCEQSDDRSWHAPE